MAGSRLVLAWAAGAALALAGCGSSDEAEPTGGISEPTAQALRGIYELTRLTRNDSGCGEEGPSIANEVTDRYFVVTPDIVLGNRILQLASCSSIEACRGTARAIQSRGSYSSDFGLILSSEVDAMHVGGFEASTGFGSADGSMCTDPEYTDHALTRSSETTVRIESRTKVLADRPSEDGFCVVRPAESRAEAGNLPCSALTALEGSRIGRD